MELIGEFFYIVQICLFFILEKRNKGNLKNSEQVLKIPKYSKQIPLIQKNPCIQRNPPNPLKVYPILKINPLNSMNHKNSTNKNPK